MIRGIILITIVALVQSTLVVDIAVQFSNYTCLKSLGIYTSIIRAYHSYGAIDLQAKNNIFLSNQAGLATDVYMFPCRGKDPVQQVKQLIDYLNSMPKQGESYYAYTTGTIWIDIQTNPSAGCSWNISTVESNCDFIGALLKAIQGYGRSVGIYATAFMWNQIFGSKQNCQNFKNYPLWYAHYDGEQSFDDYPRNPFGGWQVPLMKQFTGDSKVCGRILDVSYF